MKKSLIFWLAVSVYTAWILVGCESPTDGAPGSAGRIGDGHVGGEVSVAGLQAMIDRYDGTGAELVLDNVEITGGGVVDFKTVKAYVVGPLATDNDGTEGAAILKLVDAIIEFGTGGNIELGDANDIAIGTTAHFAGKGATGIYAEGVADLADAVGSVTAVENLTLSATATSIPTGLTVYVYGNLTVNAGSVQPTQGKVVSIGTVTLAGDNAVALADATYVDVNNAEIVISPANATRTVTLPATVDGPRFYLSGQQDDLTVTGGTTKFAAHVRGNGKLKLASAVTDVDIIGSGNIHFADVADTAISFAAGSSVTARTITFDDGFDSPGSAANVTLDGAVYIVAGKAINSDYADSTVTLKAGTAIRTTEDGTPLALRAVSDLVLTLKHADSVVTVNAGGKVAVGGANSGVEFGGDVVFGDDLTLTATPATFDKTAYFHDGKKITLTTAASIITLTADTGAFVAGEPGANPWVYDAVLQAGESNAVLTPGEAVDLTFSAGGSRGITQGATTVALVLSGDAHITSGATYTVAAGESAANILKVAAESLLTLGSGALEGQGAEFDDAAASIVLTGHANHAGTLVLANKTNGSAQAGGGGKLVLTGGGTDLGTTGDIQPAQTVTLVNLTATGLTNGVAAFTFAGSSGDLSSITSISTSPQGFKSIEAGTVSDTATTGTVTFTAGTSGTAKLDKAATLQSGS